MTQVSELHIYPIKSVAGISLNEAQVNLSGLLNDRRFMLIDESGTAVTARKHPQLSLTKTKMIGTDTWQLTHPNMSNQCQITPADFSQYTIDGTVWGDTVSGQHCHEDIDNWFSELLDLPVKLLFFGEQAQRFTSKKPDKPVAFADGYPFLLTNQASLDELNQSCPETIQMAQFRANIVVSGEKAFVEDSWKIIRIGEVKFENVSPCVRCIFTTLNPNDASRSKKGEPLKTLGKFRKLAGKGITFGVNLVALNEGSIKLTDEVEILEYKTPESYRDIR
ncbi:MOSC domain-containing protein [Marinomonas epiphytica]